MNQNFKFLTRRKEALSEIVISEEIYNEIKNYEANLIMKGKYDKAINYKWTNYRQLHYNDSEYVIIKKLKSNFGETWDNFCLKLSELREVYSKKLIVDIKMSKIEKYW